MARTRKTNPAAASVALGTFAMSGEALDKAIKSIGTMGNTLNNNIHKVGMALLYAAANSGDTSKVPQLMAALHEGLRRADVVTWVQDHSNMRITYSKAKGYAVRTLAADAEGYMTKAQLDAAMVAADKSPFWVHTKAEPVPTVITDAWLAQRLAGIIKAIDKAKDEGNLKIVMPADLAVIDSLRKQAEAVKHRVDAQVHRAGLAALKSA